MRLRVLIVSALGESWRTPAGGRLDRYLQTAIALHRGFSGSLLVDMTGAAVGLNTSGLLRGASLAVPAPTLGPGRAAASHARHRASRPSRRRGLSGPYPGVLESVAGQSTALLLVSVQPDSPAARAGLMLGDVLLSIDGQAVREVGDLLPFLDADRVGSELRARILRAGEVREVARNAG